MASTTIFVVVVDAPREADIIALPEIAVVGTDVENVADIAPAGIEIVTGTVRDVVLLAMATLTPSLVAGAFRLTVHVLAPPGVTRDVEHVSPFSDNTLLRRSAAQSCS